MDIAAKPIRQVRERYWTHKLRKTFLYGFDRGGDDRGGDKFNTDNRHFNIATKFHLCKGNIVLLIMKKIKKVFFFFASNILLILSGS